MKIGGLQKTTLIDFPNKIACTVFLSGCNFRCPWCYSPELVLIEKIKKQPIIQERDFFNFLKEKQGLLEGVVICGGEPTLNSELISFCDKIKQMGFLVKIDTNGSSPQVLKKLLENKLVDYLALDIKAPQEKYEQAIGLSPALSLVFLKKIKQSLKIIKTSKIDYELRTTVVPGLLNKADIVQIARWLSPAKKYCLQSFRPEKTISPLWAKRKPYPEKEMEEMTKVVIPFFEIVRLRC